MAREDVSAATSSRSPAKELVSLKQVLARFEHPLDAFAAKIGYQPKEPQLPIWYRPTLTQRSQIAFANDVVAAMKNRITNDLAMPWQHHLS